MNIAQTLAGVHTHTHTHTSISKEIKKVIALIKNGVLFDSLKIDYFNKIVFLNKLDIIKSV